MSKSSDKLAKLANFGNSAGSKPAAAAKAPAPAKSDRVEKTPATSEIRKSIQPEPAPVEKSHPPLIRNVAFTPDDQMHLDRIAELLREAGEFRPSISDLVRVALRGSTSLKASTAQRMLEESRKFDGRRKSLK
jgi:hypothetical protein